MMRLTAKWGGALLRLRILVLDREHTTDPFSAEYLYLVQQRKRLSLSRTVGRLRPGNIPLFPVIVVIALVKYLDLLVTNQIVQSLINERILMHHITRPQKKGK
jgi:hypothetical protein